MHDTTTSTTHDTSYDRLLNSRPIQAARDANAVLSSHTELYAFGLLLALVSTVINTLGATASLSRWLGVNGVGLFVMPLVWLLLYVAVVHRLSQSTESLRGTLTDGLSRYRAALGAHILSRGAFWGVVLTTLLGLVPIALFGHGYLQKTPATVLEGYVIGGDAASALYLPVAIAAVLGFLVTYYFQFIDLEAILNDQSPVDALRSSRRLVSANHRAVFGYVTIRGVIVGIASIPMGIAPVFDAFGGSDLELMGMLVYGGLIIGLLTLINTLLLSFLGAYHVTFYRSLRED